MGERDKRREKMLLSRIDDSLVTECFTLLPQAEDMLSALPLLLEYLPAGLLLRQSLASHTTP